VNIVSKKNKTSKMEKAQTKARELKPNKDARGEQTGGHGGGKTGNASLRAGAT